MKHYETAFLIAPDLSEEETEQLISQMEDVLKKNKGKIKNIDRWGKRKLAYPIKKYDSAFYVFFYYEGTPETYAELERQFKQKETIIRYLTLRKEEGSLLKEKAKQKPRRAKKEERIRPDDTEDTQEEASIEEGGGPEKKKEETQKTDEGEK